MRQQSRQEWDKSRVWLARAAFILIGAFVALIVSFAFKPLLALTGVLGSQLFGVSARDPLTFLAVPVVLIAVAAVACVVPARRAVSVDRQGCVGLGQTVGLFVQGLAGHQQ